MYAARRNDVIRKWRSSIGIEDDDGRPDDLSGGGINRRLQQLREVAGSEHILREPGGQNASHHFSAALIVERPESLVLDQRTADDRPELVSPQSILGIARGAGRDAKIEKVILRVEFVIAQKLEQGAMQAVSAALHGHADNR